MFFAPDSLFLFFVAGFFMVSISGMCIVYKMVILIRILTIIFDSDPGLYREITEGKGSWIERGTHSIRDFRIWANLSRMIQKNDKIYQILSPALVRRYVLCRKISYAAYFLGMAMGALVVGYGFLLVAR